MATTTSGWLKTYPVKKFAERNKKARILCLALINETYCYEGDEVLKDHFARDPAVFAKFKEAIHILPSTSDAVVPEIEQRGLSEMVLKDVAEMDVHELRSIVTAACGPEKASSTRDDRRNRFRPENAPQWWKDTGLPFVSVNHPKGQRKFGRADLCRLVTAFQHVNAAVTVTASSTSVATTASSTSVATTASSTSVATTASSTSVATTASSTSVATTASSTSVATTASSTSVATTASSISVATTTSSTSVATAASSTSVATTASSTSVATTASSTSVATTASSTSVATTASSTSVATTASSASSLKGISSPGTSFGSLHSQSTLRRKLHLNNLLKQEAKDYYAVMKVLGTCEDWQEFCCLCDDVKSELPTLSEQLSNSWTVPTLLDSNPLYKNHIPASVGNRVCLTAKADGNCIFNSISTSLYGNETNAKLVRLASVVHMAEYVLDYSKYIVEEFKENAQAWIAAICGNPPTGDLRNLAVIEKICREEIMETVRNPYRDCSMFHLHMVANVLRRPITNHFSGNRHEFLLGQYLFPPLSEVLYPAAIHLAWVPTKPSRYATINHVVPAVCPLGPFGTHLDECVFEGLQCCTVMHNANPEINPKWIECSRCGQWMHDVCIKMDISNITEEDEFFCGCDRIANEKVKLKRILLLTTLHHCVDTSTKMMVTENLKDIWQWADPGHLRMI
ncbi:serine-rich adhesin for platelets-like [Pecten maximus]|uniref:serine-rich adhesin for platelets-like n=1 Tax=Pecten maximus TaxID=6579 RepID=UPI001458D58E|nr:serine-rich adhesin for platelets-like [Pecten maximus]